MGVVRAADEIQIAGESVDRFIVPLSHLSSFFSLFVLNVYCVLISYVPCLALANNSGGIQSVSLSLGGKHLLHFSFPFSFPFPFPFALPPLSPAFFNFSPGVTLLQISLSLPRPLLLLQFVSRCVGAFALLFVCSAYA